MVFLVRPPLLPSALSSAELKADVASVMEDAGVLGVAPTEDVGMRFPWSLPTGAARSRWLAALPMTEARPVVPWKAELSPALRAFLAQQNSAFRSGISASLARPPRRPALALSLPAITVSHRNGATPHTQERENEEPR